MYFVQTSSGFILEIGLTFLRDSDKIGLLYHMAYGLQIFNALQAVASLQSVKTKKPILLSFIQIANFGRHFVAVSQFKSV